MDKIEEIALTNTHQWGQPPYSKLDFPQWKGFINLETCSPQEFNTWMAGYARWLAEKKALMLSMIDQNWNLDFAMLFNQPIAQRQEFAREALMALNRHYPHHDGLKQADNNEQLVAAFNQLFVGHVVLMFGFKQLVNEDDMVYMHKRYVKRTVTLGVFWTMLAVGAVLLINHMSMKALQAEYKEWNDTYDPDELLRSISADMTVDRFAIWLKSRAFVKSHQSTSYSVHLNQFASLTDSEFVSMLGTDNPVGRLQWPHFDCTLNYPSENKIDLNSLFDWRNAHVVSPVRNQAACGSCWAFAAMASLEGVRAIKTGELNHLSTQQLVDCAVGEYGTSDPYPNHGCNGGLPESAFTYMRRVGFLSDDAYPYYAVDQNCTLDDERFGKELNDNLVKIKSCHYVPADSPVLLARSLVQNGPHAVALDASKISFRLYKEGIYYDEECSSERLSHGTGGCLISGMK